MSFNVVNPGNRFRLDAQADTRRVEGINSLGPAPGSFEEPGKGKRISWGITQWVFTVFAILAFVGLVLMGRGAASLQTTGILALVALVPLFVVTLVLAWIDRWAPVSWRLKILALGLGAGLGGGGAIIFNSGLNVDILLYSGDPMLAEFRSAVFVAPISEETFKGLGVVLILLWARHQIATPISGFAIGGFVGAGFAYVENIMYFVQAHAEGSAVLGLTVIGRGLMSPFVHPMSTSFTGLMFAWALLSQAKVWGWIWRLLLGLGIAMGLHSLWNFLASSAGAMWYFWYAVIELPLLIGWLSWILTWSARQAKAVAHGLQSYVQTGWVREAEVQMVTNRVALKYAKKWGKRIGSPAPKLVRKFVAALRRLGLDQEVMSKTGPNRVRMENDQKLLSDVDLIRIEFEDLEQLRAGMA